MLTLEKLLSVRDQTHTLSDFLQSKRSQRSTTTAIPMATTVRIPLTLEDQVQAMKNPVASIQAHQSNVNSLSDRLSVSITKRSFVYSLVTIFAELDIRIDRQRHEEDQNRVKQDQSRLRNVGIVWLPLVSPLEHPRSIWELTEKDYDCRESSNDSRVSTLLHDIVHNRNRETTEYSWQGTHSPVWDVIGRIAVTDVREVKIALKTNKPSRKSEQQLREWGMDIEVVLATQIVGRELAEMNLVKTVRTKA
jgi:hypothetical protein